VFQGAKGVKEQSVLRSNLFQGAKGVEKHSVLRSKVFWETKSVEKQGVMRSKGFWLAKGVKEQSVTRSKGFWVAKGVKEQGVMRSKGFWVAKGVKEQGVLRSKLWLCQVFWAAKCVKWSFFREASLDGSGKNKKFWFFLLGLKFFSQSNSSSSAAQCFQLIEIWWSILHITNDF
jgi:hypothetical protein